MQLPIGRSVGGRSLEIPFALSDGGAVAGYKEPAIGLGNRVGAFLGASLGITSLLGILLPDDVFAASGTRVSSPVPAGPFVILFVLGVTVLVESGAPELSQAATGASGFMFALGMTVFGESGARVLSPASEGATVILIVLGVALALANGNPLRMGGMMLNIGLVDGVRVRSAGIMLVLGVPFSEGEPVP